MKKWGKKVVCCPLVGGGNEKRNALNIDKYFLFIDKNGKVIYESP